MKKLLMVAALGAAGLAGTSAQAATVNDTFDVDINLTSVCAVNVTTNVLFAYTSGQAGNQASTGGDVSVTCTSGVPYTFSLIHNSTGLAPVFPVNDATVNLTYTLTAPAGATGNGGAQAHTIAGDMGGGQAGTCPGGVCNNGASGNKTYTLVVTY
jgi:spore coat protein U-like protein